MRYFFHKILHINLKNNGKDESLENNPNHQLSQTIRKGCQKTYPNTGLIFQKQKIKTGIYARMQMKSIISKEHSSLFGQYLMI